jgi:hypothetical protein
VAASKQRVLGGCVVGTLTRAGECEVQSIDRELQRERELQRALQREILMLDGMEQNTKTLAPKNDLKRESVASAAPDRPHEKPAVICCVTARVCWAGRQAFSVLLAIVGTCVHPVE